MSDEELKDSGTRRSFDSGAVRDAQENKGRFDLLPFWPQLAYAVIMEAGAKKYSANNWRKGMPISIYINSAIRHLEKYKMGLRDEPHLWQALWNVSCAVHAQIQIYLGLYPKTFNDLFDDINGGTAQIMSNKIELLAIEPYKNMILETNKFNSVVKDT